MAPSRELPALAVVTEAEAAPDRERSHRPATPGPAPGRPGTRAGRRLDAWALAAVGVTLLALGLRLAGLGFGLPYHYHWDEPTIMNRVIRMGGGDLNPHFFYYPTLLMYALLGAQGALYVAGRALHLYASSNAFAVAYLTDSTASYLVGRGLVALLGAGSVLLTFVVGRRFLSAPAGLIGAVLLAVSPVHVGSSHFVTNDVPMAFFALLACVFLWDVYTRGRGRDYVAAGAAIGLGISTKYLPVVLLVSLALAHAFRLREETGGWRSTLRDWRLLAAGAGAAALAFALTSPYVVLDVRAALHDYQVQAGLSSAAGCSNCPPNFLPYLSDTMPWSVGWPAYLLALAGLASLAWAGGERRRRGILLASFPVMLFLMVGSERQPWARWLVPVAPFAALAAGAVAWAALGRLAAGPLARRGPRWAPAALALAAVAAMAAAPAFASVRYDRALLAADPRTEAAAWFDSSVPDGTTVAVQPLLDRYFFTAQMMTDTQLAAVEAWVPPSKPEVRAAVDETLRRSPVYHEAPFTYDVAALRAQGVRYVVLSSLEYHNVDPPVEDRFYAALASQARLVARFTPPVDLPDAKDYPASMPVITVYELPAS